MNLTDHHLRNVCSSCSGLGRKWYGNGGTWHPPGMATQGHQRDLCNVCWGSGDDREPFMNMRKFVDDKNEQVRSDGAKVLAGKARIPFASMRAGCEALAAELERLARGRKERPSGFEAMATILADELRKAKGEE